MGCRKEGAWLHKMHERARRKKRRAEKRVARDFILQHGGGVEFAEFAKGKTIREIYHSDRGDILLWLLATRYPTAVVVMEIKKKVILDFPMQRGPIYHQLIKGGSSFCVLYTTLGGSLKDIAEKFRDVVTEEEMLIAFPP